MKRALLTVTYLVAFGLVSASSAQSTGASNQSSSQHTKKEVTLSGCVQQMGDEFMLQTSQKKNVELETTEDLKPHVGHTVKVTGDWDKAADKNDAHAGSSTTGAHNEAAEHQGAKEHHFKVSKIAMVSDTCAKTAAKK
jgi:hypothetical protein